MRTKRTSIVEALALLVAATLAAFAFSLLSPENAFPATSGGMANAAEHVDQTEDTLHVFYRYYEGEEDITAVDHAKFDARMSREDGWLVGKVNNALGALPLPKENLVVYLDFAAGDHMQRDITSECMYDEATGIVKVPEEYAGRQISAVFELECGHAYDIPVSITASVDGDVVLESEKTFASDGHLMMFDIPAEVTATENAPCSVVVRQNGYKVFDEFVSFVPSTGSLAISASPVGGPITVEILTDAAAAPVSGNAAVMKTMLRANAAPHDEAQSTASPASARSASSPQVGDRFDVTLKSANGDSRNRVYGADYGNIGINNAFGYPEHAGEYHFYVIIKTSECDLVVGAGRPGNGGTGNGGGPDSADYDYDWTRKYSFIECDCISQVNNGTGPYYAASAFVEVMSIANGRINWKIEAHGVKGSDGAAGQSVRGYFSTELPYGTIELTKKTSNADITSGNANYSLSNAKYGVYSSKADAQANRNPVATLTTNGSGKASNDQIEAGTYYVKEISASKNYQVDKGTHSVTVVAGRTSKLTVSEIPSTLFPPSVGKIDGELGTALPQGDATLAGAQFTVKFYTSANATGTPARTWVLEVDENGKIAFDDAHKISGDPFYKQNGEIVLPIGSISWQETRSPSGYLVNGDIQTRPVKSGKQVAEITTADEVMRGGFKIQKWDAELDRTEPQGDGDYEGVHIVVYNRSSNSVVVKDTEYGVGDICYEFDLSAGGSHATASDLLPYGTYELRETNGSDNGSYYANDSWTQLIEIRADGDIIELTALDKGPNDQVLRGGIAVQKFASEVSDGTVHQSQNGSFPGIRLSSTFGKDEQAISAMTLEDALVVAAGGEDVLSSDMFGMAYDECQTTASDPMAVAQAGAAFKGAEITIYNESGHSVNIPGQGVVSVGGVVKVLTLDANGYAETGAHDLPYGTYTLKETKAPTGYHINTSWSKTVEVREEGKIYEVGLIPENGTNLAGVDDQVIRGDYEFVKNASDSQGALPFTPFLLVNLQSGENHVITTNENGEFYSAAYVNGAPYNLHTNNTNANDDAITWHEDGSYTIDDAKLDNFAGVWFTGYGPLNDPDGVLAQCVEPNDSLGALPFGKYALIELEGESNIGYENVVKTFTVTRDGFSIKGGTVTDEWIEIVLQTTAKDAVTGDNYGSLEDDTTTIIDEIAFSAGLREGEEYIFTGVLMDRTTNESIKTEDGTEIMSETKHVVTADEATNGGVVEVVFEDIPSEVLRGKITVVFEDLYTGNGTWIASHADIEDEGQTVYYPEIRTTATDGMTGDHEGFAGADGTTVVISDEVAYSGLKIGETYTMTGTLMDKETGEPIEGAEPVSVEFMPETSSGTVEVVFEVPAEVLRDKTTVVFESCYQGEREVAAHADIEDKGQTVKYPEIHTTATDGLDGDKVFSGQQTVTLVDTVEFSNLTPGTEYVMVGQLMDKQTEQLVPGIEPVSQAFTPESSDGVMEMTFTFDATQLVGHDIVVFEECYRDFDANSEITGNELVADHKDIHDEGQTVNVRDAGLADELIADQSLSKTGDSIGSLILIGSFVIIMSSAAALFYYLKRRN